MFLQEKGWLKEYLEYRKELFLGLTDKSRQHSSHPDHALYRIVQPTGLMYGECTGAVDLPEYDHLPEKDRLKILLAESLVSSSLLFHDKPITNEEEFSSTILKTVESIANFYNHIFPEISTPSRTIFGRKKSSLEVAERILSKRINEIVNHHGSFWTSFFRNSLLFLDVFIFGQWIHTNADKIVADFFRYEREELRFSIVKVIAAAAHANKIVAPEEKRFFDFFLQTTELPADRKKEAMRIFAEGIAVQDINLPAENSWLLKKFFLEIAILTIWADKEVEETEIEFLRAFCRYFEFTEDELVNSMVAIEGFVLENWHHLAHLHDSHRLEDVSEEYVGYVSRIAERNTSLLLNILKKRDAVTLLIERARSNKLTPDEKENLRVQLLEVLKNIPALSMTSLPHRFLTLPILLKILPKNLFTA